MTRRLRCFTSVLNRDPSNIQTYLTLTDGGDIHHYVCSLKDLQELQKTISTLIESLCDSKE